MMSFPLLLLLLSLVVVIPVAFVIKDKSRQQQLTHNNQHQRYITHKAQGELHKARPDLKISDTIQDYRNHPKLPISFRQLLGKIHEQYIELAAVQLAPDQRFTVDKLLGTRLPEVLDDYLALEAQYAEETIIDTVHSLTSKDVTYGQLSNMLAFMQRVAADGQDQVASNILANRNYLQSVYGEFYQEDGGGVEGGNPATKAPKEDKHQEDLASDLTLYARGESYLQDCDDLVSIAKTAHEPLRETVSETINKSASEKRQQAPIEASQVSFIAASQVSLKAHQQVLGASIVSELGQLVGVAERTLMYTDALLPSTLSLQAFDRIISHAIPNLLRQTIAAQINQSINSATSANPANPVKNDVTTAVGQLKLSTSQQALVEQKIIRFGQLLEECLSSLERVASQQNKSAAIPTDILQQLQNTISSKQAQAQYLLDSGFFEAA